jgi:hypothetical protein
MAGYCFKPSQMAPASEYRAGGPNLGDDFSTGCVLVGENRYTVLFTETVKNGVTTPARVISWMDPHAEGVKKTPLEKDQYVYVSRTPFALYGPKINGFFNKPFYAGPNLIMACQVRKGELGQKPEIIQSMPTSFETLRDHREYYQDTGRRLERLWPMHWVKLTEICRTTELGAHELLEGYLPFADPSDSGGYQAPWFMVTDDPSKIVGEEVGRPIVRRSLIVRNQMRNDPVMPDADPMHIYISVFWARNILRLHDLGYQPGMFEQVAQVASTS